jgi:hypothetical protein
MAWLKGQQPRRFWEDDASKVGIPESGAYPVHRHYGALPDFMVARDVERLGDVQPAHQQFDVAGVGILQELFNSGRGGFVLNPCDHRPGINDLG